MNDGSAYLNRELSWLEFNARVLSLAADETIPLLERCKFCAIFSSNLDEFHEVRVAGLQAQAEALAHSKSIDGLTAGEQLRAIAERVAELVANQSAIFTGLLRPALQQAGVALARWEDLTPTEAKAMQQVFDDGIFPVLTPLSVDPGHPFPYMSNLSLNLAATVRDPETGRERFARVKVPPLLPRFVTVSEGRFLPLEELIAAQLGALFPGMETVGVHPFRLTRNADVELEEGEVEDLLEAVETELRRRRFGEPVRLEVTSSMPPDIVLMLIDELDLDAHDVTVIDGLLDLGALMSLRDLDRPDLKDEPWSARTPAIIAGSAGPDGAADLFAVMRNGDVLVHHPYESFRTTVERFIAQAAADPAVLTIKITLYRTSGNSPIVQSLIDAVERGKQVAVLIELKARFDEQANIAWARALEEAGVHVVYGLIGLKTHTKVTLVVRNESDGLRRYCHVATGNYNSATARLYEDFGLFSADPELGADLTKLFNHLTGYSRTIEYARLIVAPTSLRNRIIELIEQERGQGGNGAIVLKMNSLTDQQVIDALYRASQAGVRVDLIVRGICCLRPGVTGLSDNISVRSIVGRFLEHSRIFRFANAGGEGEPGWFIGSADMMNRNLDNRIEVVVPVIAEALCERLDQVLKLLLVDDTLAWTLAGSGVWVRVEGATVNAQLRLAELAIERSVL